MPESKKVVIKVDIHDAKNKRKAMKAVSSLSGIVSLAMDKDKKVLTVIGDIDPVEIVGKLKKWHTEIVTVGPAKDDKKKDDAKDGEKKGDEKKDGDKKKDEEAIKKWVEAYKAYNPYMTQHYYVHSVEEYPNGGCVIC